MLDADTFTERVRLSGHTDFIGWAETSPTNKVVATSSGDGTVRLWSMDSGEPRHVFETNPHQSCSGAFSPDGELAAAGARDGLVRIWGVDTGELLHSLAYGVRDRPQSLAFSFDGLHLAAGASGGGLRIFNFKSEECEQSWQIAVEPDCAAFLDITQVQYNPGGDLFFTSSEGHIFGYRVTHNLKWDFFEPGYQDMLSTSGGVALLAGGSKLIAAFGSNVVIWKTD
ncbi:WD40-repeat-containing domain protein [Mycena galopus ATCC 62051]|nr:WD40-repeat-containing domain protein [Mycena galopus ATCC 62051]